jgi:outer membrane protein assembly factor BamB/tetratricopeptide (TPR) repeat protein
MNLSDLFQSLGMNQQEGTLTVYSEDKHTDVYFSNEGIRLLTSDKQKYPRLGEILVRRHIVTPSQLQEALEKQKESGALLGEILIFQKVVTEDDIESCVRSQIEEIIYDVFSWKDAKFEFQVGEPTEEFFDQTATGRKITFNIQGIIMEAARRIDEWERIHKVIPSSSHIFAVAVDSASFDPEQAEYPQKMVMEVMGLVDGMKSVEEICRESPYSTFETSKIMAFLIQSDQLRPLTTAEYMAVAFRLREEGHFEDSASVYRSVIDKEPQNDAAREALAEILKHLGRAGEAAAEFAELGKAASEAGDEEKAMGYLNKAVELSSKCLLAHEQLRLIYIARERWKEAARESLDVAKVYRDYGRLDDVRKILEASIEKYPGDIEARQLLINALVEKDDKADHQALIKNYEELARELGSRSEFGQAQVLYKKILHLDSRRSDIRSKLEGLQGQRTGRRRMAGWVKVLIVLLIIAVLIGGGLATWVVFNGKADKESASAVEKLNKRIDLAIQQAGEKENPTLIQSALEDIREEFESIRKRLWWSKLVLFETRIAAELNKVDKKALENKKEIEDRLGSAKTTTNSLLSEAHELEQAGRYEEALAKYRTIDPGYLEESGRPRLNQSIKKIEDHLKAAKEAYEEVVEYQKKIEAAGDPAELERYVKAAFEAGRRLARTKNSAQYRLLRFPLYIETRPEGADVIFAGKRHPRRTPTVIFYSPEMPESDIRLEMVSFKPRIFKLKPKTLSRRADGWQKKTILEKNLSWSFKGGARVARALVAFGRFAALGDYDGKLYFVDSESGKKSWHYGPREALAEFYASPLIHSGKAYIPGSNKYCYAVNLTNRREIWKQLLPAPVKHTPAMGDNGIIYVATEKSLHALDTGNSGNIIWSVDLTVEGRRGVVVAASPVVFGEYIVTATADGRIFAFSAKDGVNYWSHTLPGRIANQLMVFRDKVLVPCQDGKLYALNPADKKVAWSIDLKGMPYKEPVTAPVTFGDNIIIGMADGRLLCLDCTGEPGFKWEYRLRIPAVVSPVVEGRMIYVSCRDGSVSALRFAADAGNTAPVLQWEYSFPPGEEVEITSSVIAGGKLIVAAKNGTLHAFDK